MILCVHWLNFSFVMAYFEIIMYLGVFQDGRRTKTLGDFFVVGGWEALQSYNSAHLEIRNLIDHEKMTIWAVLALNLSVLVVCIVAPWIYTWISVSKDEKAATQGDWGHLWKRLVTMRFAIYGILFTIYKPGLDDSENSWRVVMNEVLPIGVPGLLIASFDKCRSC
jgi:SSS family solute:Na+ symporter